jgi:nitrate reductase NapE component
MLTAFVACYALGFLIWAIWAYLHYLDGSGPCSTRRGGALLVLAAPIWPILFLGFIGLALFYLLRDAIFGDGEEL